MKIEKDYLVEFIDGTTVRVVGDEMRSIFNAIKEGREFQAFTDNEHELYLIININNVKSFYIA